MHAPEAAELVARHIGFALAIARSWGRRFPWLSDCFASDASYATWKAAVAHDPARGEFRALVRVVVRRALANRLAAERAKNPAAFRAQVAPGTTHPLDALLDARPGPDEAASRADELAGLARRLDRVPARSRAVLVRHVGHGEPVAALAAELGVSPARVRQLAAAAIRKARGE